MSSEGSPDSTPAEGPERVDDKRMMRGLAGLATVLGTLLWAQGSAGYSASTSLTPVEHIDVAIRTGWQESQLRPSARATEREFCRRLFLDVLGRIPTIDELERYASDRRPDRQQRWVELLLYDEAYTSDYATHWSTIWTNLLIGRGDGDRRDDRVDRAGLRTYLLESFTQNKPYDRLVYEIISATGTNRPGEAGFNGAVNFLSGKLEDGATQATAQTAKLFLGMQVQCTQCHNHPFNEWKQNQFWQLNSFFRQTTALRRFEPGTRDVRCIELTDEDFAGEDRPSDPENARIYYELRNGRLEAAFPVFVDGTAIATSGLVRQVNRRRELADLIVHSPDLPRALVNRFWAHFLGFGFTRPVDDMGPHNPATYPELLTYLADQFREHSFDLKQLISWIVLSEPYGLSSETTRQNAQDDPLLGQAPRYSHFYVRQMSPEQLYRSLLVAIQTDKSPGSADDQQAAEREWLQQFTIALGTDEGDETTTFDGTITQTLMMFNGELMRRATEAKPGSFLYHIASDTKARPRSKLRQLYLAAVARQPTTPEWRAYQQLYVYHQQNELPALEDIWWALLNSNEFILNH